MALIEVTLEDAGNTRGWRDPKTMEPTTKSTLVVEADDLDKAKAYAEAQNPGLQAIDAKEQK